MKDGGVIPFVIVRCPPSRIPFVEKEWKEWNFDPAIVFEARGYTGPAAELLSPTIHSNISALPSSQQSTLDTVIRHLLTAGTKRDNR